MHANVLVMLRLYIKARLRSCVKGIKDLFKGSSMQELGGDVRLYEDATKAPLRTYIKALVCRNWGAT